MVGKFDREAGQSLNGISSGTGFITAMLGLGVICSSNSLPRPASKGIRLETLRLGRGRPGKI